MPYNPYIFCFKSLIVALLCVLVAGTVNAQKHDTVKTKGIYNHFTYLDKPDEIHVISNTVHNIEEYGFNQNREFEYFNLGNRGYAAYPIIFRPYHFHRFDDGQRQFSIYRATFDSMKLYKVLRPFTELEMTIGTRGETVFRGSHAQQLKNNFSFGVDFHRLRSEGILANMETRHNGFTLYGDYYLPSGRFHHMSALLANIELVEENGGLAADDIFNLGTTAGGALSVDVVFDNAATEQKEVKYLMRNEFAIGPVFDSVLSDSVLEKKVVPKYVLGHEATLGRNFSEFIDPNPDNGLYQLYYPVGVDSAINLLKYRLLANKVYIKMPLGRAASDSSSSWNRHWPLKLGLEHENYELTSNDRQATFNNFSVFIQLKHQLGKKKQFRYQLDGRYTFSGFNQENMSISEVISYQQKRWKATLFVKYNKFSPGWTEQYYTVGDIDYFFGAEKTDQLTAGAEFEIGYTNKQHTKTRLRVENHLIYDYLYWDENAIPLQFEGGINVFIASLTQNFQFGDFYFDNTISFQQISEPELFARPKLFAKHSFYYQKGIFKGLLILNTGIDVRYSSEFFPYAYHPVLGQFYLQTEERQTIQPVINVFVNARIKTVRLFMLFNNLTDRFNFNNYSGKYFPWEDSAFKAGVKWRFLE